MTETRFFGFTCHLPMALQRCAEGLKTWFLWVLLHLFQYLPNSSWLLDDHILSLGTCQRQRVFKFRRTNLYLSTEMFARKAKIFSSPKVTKAHEEKSCVNLRVPSWRNFGPVSAGPS